jgi:hypothetical protein
VTEPTGQLTTSGKQLVMVYVAVTVTFDVMLDGAVVVVVELLGMLVLLE